MGHLVVNTTASYPTKLDFSCLPPSQMQPTPPQDPLEALTSRGESRSTSQGAHTVWMSAAAPTFGQDVAAEDPYLQQDRGELSREGLYVVSEHMDQVSDQEWLSDDDTDEDPEPSLRGMAWRELLLRARIEWCLSMREHGFYRCGGCHEPMHILQDRSSWPCSMCGRWYHHDRCTGEGMRDRRALLQRCQSCIGSSGMLPVDQDVDFSSFQRAKCIALRSQFELLKLVVLMERGLL